MGYSYGYPLFNFYPPFPYYLGEIFRLTGFSYIDSTKIVFGLGFLVSGILMYLFTRRLWGDWGGLLSAVLYLYAPYHSLDVYVRGAMNEFWAIAFFPGVCWAVYEIVEREKKKEMTKYISLMALFFALLLLSHNLMALIFTPTVVVLALLLIWQRKKNLREKIISLALGGIWGIGLAAFFTLPVILEKKYVHVETMLMGYFNYLAHFVPIGKMLFTRYWGYGSSGWQQDAGMPFQVGFPLWPLAVLVFMTVSILFLKKKIDKEKFILISLFFLVSLFALFLAHPRSVLIWKAIPALAYLQFPWRFLTLVIFGWSVVGGGLLVLFKKEKWQKLIALAIVILTVSLNYSFFRVEKTIRVSDTEKLFSAKGWNKLQTDAIFDYLPVYAKAPPGGPAPEKPEIKEGKAKISEVEKGTDWYRFDIKVEEQAKVQVPVYDFPGWKATIDNEKTKITHDNHLGLITVYVPAGGHRVALALTNTPVRALGNLFSLLAWGGLFIYGIKALKNKKKQ